MHVVEHMAGFSNKVML